MAFDETTGERRESGVSAAEGGRKPEKPGRILFYRNPMGLPDTSATPKKDSMGMDYIPVYEGDDQGSTVTVDPGKRQRTGVRTEAVVRRSISVPVRASGVIQIDERRVSVVAVRAQSFVNKVEQVTTGDHVRRGQVLMRLYSPEVAAAAAQYLSIVGQPTAAGKAVVDGARRRLENLDVPAAVIDEVERSKRAPLDFAWTSPRDGVVLSRKAVDGMQAMPGEEMFRIADLASVWAVLDIPESQLPLVMPGQKVTVRPRGSTIAFEGRIQLIYPEINAATRTARLRVELANPDGALKPEMYADADIETGAGTPVLAAPLSAVIDSGDRRVALIEKGEGRFEPRDVTTGRSGDGYVEVRSGLAEGDQVVVAANFLIDAESNLKAALSGLSAGASQ
ncbi:Cu(I)/Ag(I) efflux system membrane fusion protein [Methylopila jiangsuensis]|uniref:efflux RND transporter periplasmic adaptor subunit n=1 Tax=Methylopila jiangsuensis TaxID=586230 RepID=UPI0022F2FFD4|nr:efflux RND transporter periplasmic adaptor subunit [Methylopila jiangsuensis]MDR6284982.1 Cu(I)/Ag(I) efflux system membrane fusion protein [Methylopila jiangsuensis]